MATQPRWKVKPKGFATVKVDGWWTKPGEPTAPIPGTTGSGGGRSPRGGTFSTQTRSAARNSLVPREWVGSPGLIGNWAKAPRLDPTKFETLKSSETNRWWARPINELTGLDPQSVASVRAFDTQTAGQGSRIDQAYANFVTQSGQTAQQGSAALTGLAGLMGSGYSGDPTGAVLSEAAKKEAGAGLAPEIANLMRLPALAGSQGITARQSYDAQRATDRTGLISGIKQSAADAASAEADRNVTLRGQELDALGRAAGLQSDQTIAAADRQARVDMNTQDNATSASNAALRVTAAEKAAAKKAGRKPPTTSDIRQWAKRARAMWDGVPAQQVDPKTGEVVKGVTKYSPEEILRELIAAGATKQRAPSCSAERAIAPRLCGSWIWSSATTTRPFLRSSSSDSSHSPNVADGS